MALMTAIIIATSSLSGVSYAAGFLGSTEPPPGPSNTGSQGTGSQGTGSQGSQNTGSQGSQNTGSQGSQGTGTQEEGQDPGQGQGQDPGQGTGQNKQLQDILEQMQSDSEVLNEIKELIYCDPVLQFYPTVGVLYSINSSNDTMLNGNFAWYKDLESDGKDDGNVDYGESKDNQFIAAGSDDRSVKNWEGPGSPCLWQPNLDELPNIVSQIGRSYRYAVLVGNYWDTHNSAYFAEHVTSTAESWPYHKRFNLSGFAGPRPEDMERRLEQLNEGNEGAPIPITFPEANEWGNKEKKSYQYYQQEESVKKEGKNDEKSKVDVGIMIDGAGSPVKVGSDLSKSKYATGVDNAGQSYTLEEEILSDWQDVIWYRDTSNAVTDHQHSTINMESASALYKDASEDARRSLDILGFDILLRDEYVTRMKLTVAGQTEYHFGYYYDSVTDEYRSFSESATGANSELHTTPITLDYIVQCLYRAMGVSQLRYELFFFADMFSTADYTNIATEMTINLDQVNDAQNRVDCFVTRTGLTNYWNRAVKEGLVSNNYDKNGKEVLVFDQTNIGKSRYIDKNGKKCVLTPQWTSSGTVGGFTQKLVVSQVNSARLQELTLGEFCKLAKSFMHVYGEPVMTEQEQNLLLYTYGAVLPYSIDDIDHEQFEAIKYMIAKGICPSTMDWTGKLTLEDMLVMLARIKDKESRLTFKEIELTYDVGLLQAGYYPMNVTLTEDNVAGTVQAVNHTKEYKDTDEVWYDYYLRVVEFKDSDTGLSFGSNFYQLDADGKPFTPIQTLAIRIGKEYHPEYIQRLPDVHFSDGYTYIHVKINRAAFGGVTETENGYSGWVDIAPLSAKDHEDEFRPHDWRVDQLGGIYMMPDYIGVENQDEKRIYWNSSGARGEKSKTRGLVKSATESLEDLYKDEELQVLITLDDLPALITRGGSDNNPTYTISKTNIVKEDMWKTENGKELFNADVVTASQVASWDSRGYITAYHRIEHDLPKSENNAHMTFDEAGYGAEYVDDLRFKTGYSIALTSNPYLDDGPADVESYSPQSNCDILFYIMKNNDSTGTLIGDVYYGEMNEDSNKIIHYNEPSTIYNVDKNNPKVEYLWEEPEKAYYVLHDAQTSGDVNNQLHLQLIGHKDSETVPTVSNNCIAYQNDTFLIEWETLKATAQGLYNMNNISLTVIDGSDYAIITWVHEGLPFTIYMSNSLHKVSVNNVVYTIPQEEMVFYRPPNENTTYVNYRVCIGWGNGFAQSCFSKFVGIDGNATLSINKRVNPTYYTLITSTKQCLNFFTGSESKIYAGSVQDGDDYFISLNKAYPWSNFALLDTGTEGIRLYVYKNNDVGCKDSCISELSKSTDGNYKKLLSLYESGATDSQDLLQTTLGTNFGDMKAVDSILCSAWILVDYDSKDAAGAESNPAIQLYCNIDDVKDMQEKEKVHFFRNKATGEWYYRLPRVTSLPSKLQDQKEPSGFDYIDWVDFYRDYYFNIQPLPLFLYRCGIADTISQGGAYDDEYVYDQFVSDIGCNIIIDETDPLPYGTVIWAMAHDDGRELPDPMDMSYTPYQTRLVVRDTLYDEKLPGDKWYLKTSYLEGTTSTYVYYEDNKVVTCPIGVMATAMTASRAFNLSGYPSDRIHGMFGNYEVNVTPNTDGTVNIDIPIDGSGMGRGVKFFNLLDELEVKIVTYNTTDVWVQIPSYNVSLTQDRLNALEDLKKGTTSPADDIPTFDWDTFTFNSLVSDLNSGLTVFLVIVLNIIPRVCMFICILLIGLSTITNIKPWRKFCTEHFDIYSVLTMGHATVDTVNTSRLFISSIIGLALFGLFMDGTIINLLTWITQGLIGIMER